VCAPFGGATLFRLSTADPSLRFDTKPGLTFLHPAQGENKSAYPKILQATDPLRLTIQNA
jgi:hypothetical protein